MLNESITKKVFNVYGQILSSESVYQLTDIDDEKNDMEFIDKPLAQIGKVSLNPFSVEFDLQDGLKFSISNEEISSKRRFNGQGKYVAGIVQKIVELDIIIADLSRLYIRIKDLSEYPLSKLNKKKIAIVGLGSGGSLISLYLAKSGIQNFTFIDDDIIEDHNIIRHVCSLKDLGRFKTLAVKDYLLERIPDLNIVTVEENFKIDTKEDEGDYRNLLKDVDLLIAGTGDHAVNSRINQFAYGFGIPVIYAGVFDKVSGGVALRIDPTKGDTCYNCIYHKKESANTNVLASNDLGVSATTLDRIPNTSAIEKTIAYDRNLEDLLSQPGLSLDIDNFSLIVVKFILSTIIEKEQNYGIDGWKNSVIKTNNVKANPNTCPSIYPFPYDIYIWYNRDIFDENNLKIKEGMELYYYDHNAMSEYITKRKECYICGNDYL